MLVVLEPYEFSVFSRGEGTGVEMHIDREFPWELRGRVRSVSHGARHALSVICPPGAGWWSARRQEILPTGVAGTPRIMEG